MLKTMAFAAVLLLSGTAMADVQDFTLENSTGDTIDQVYVESSKSDEWGDDVLDRDVLEDGDTVDVSFDGYGGQCTFDMKAVYTDGETVVWGDLDLCNLSTLTLFWNKKTGETWAVAK